MTDEVSAVVMDTNLSPAACRIVLYVRSLGEGAHEIKQTKFMALLNHPGEKAVRTAVQLAEDTGYLERTPGGRGHFDRYTFRVPPQDSLSDSPAKTAGLNDADSPAKMDSLSDRVPQDATLNFSPAPQGSLKSGQSPFSPAKNATLKDSPAEIATLKAPNALSPAKIATLNAPLVRARVGGEDGVKAGGEGEEEKTHTRELDRSALQAIESAGEKLTGCRGALRDYLTARVPKDQQYGYVQTVVTWIDNPLAAFRRPDGMPVPVEERAGLLALALNEMAATDETTRKHKRGDPANLRNKLGFVIRDRYSKTESRTPPNSRSPPANEQYDDRWMADHDPNYVPSYRGP